MFVLKLFVKNSFYFFPISDEVINLSLVSPQTWEDAISKKLWEKVAPYVFENIYLPASALTNNNSQSRPISMHNRTGK